MPVAIDHIDLRVPDLAAAESFLTRLGFEVFRRHASRSSIELRLPGSEFGTLEVRESADVTTTTLDHIAVRAADAHGVRATWEARGVEFTGPFREIAETGRSVANVVDPGGLKWQLTD
ncbi:MAG: VOC family protein [Protaetiibacter sp.]